MLIFIRKLIFILILIFMQSCTDTRFRCIDADNFGTMVDIGINSNNYMKLNDSKYILPIYEYAEWQDTGQVISGIDSLNIVVKTSDDGAISGWFRFFNNKAYEQYKMGVSLYLLITDKNPNLNINTINNPKAVDPSAIIVHLKCDSQGCPTYNGESSGGIFIEDTQALAGKKIYFRILSNSYHYNLGNYNIVIRTGLKSNKSDIIGDVANIVVKNVRLATEGFYKGILGQGSSLGTVIKTFILMYVVIFGLMFGTGMIKATTGEFAMSFTKVGLLSIMISDRSWDFFYNNLFQGFLDAPLKISAIMVGYNSDNPTGIFNSILVAIANEDIFNKIIGVIFANFGIGLLLFLIYGITVCILAVGVFLASMMFMLSYVGLAFVIGLAPFFFPFILFRYTYNTVFMQWLKFLIANIMQIVIVISFYGFFQEVVLNQLYRNLGFRVCWEVVIDFKLFQIYNWKVNVTRDIKKIDIPGYFYDYGSGLMCEPYQCSGYRYIHLPFLKPDPTSGDMPRNVNTAISRSSGYNINTSSYSQTSSIGLSDAERLWNDAAENDQPLVEYFFANMAPDPNEAGIMLGTVFILYLASFMITALAKELGGMPYSQASGGALDLVEREADDFYKQYGSQISDMGLGLAAKTMKSKAQGLKQKAQDKIDKEAEKKSSERRKKTELK